MNKETTTETEYYDNGQKKSEGEYRAGKKHGKWTFWHENGKKESEGEWRDGKQQGKWITWYESGRKEMEVEFQNGKKNGKQTQWHGNEKKGMEVEFLDGKRHGLTTIWSRCGKLSDERLFDNGIEIDRVNYYELVNPCDDIWEKLQKRMAEEIDKEIVDELLGSIP